MNQTVQITYLSDRKCYRLLASQWIDVPRNEAFEFFSDENNLQELTPAFLGFRVLGKDTDTIQTGTHIDYTLSLHGVPVRWRTVILDWDPPNGFRDLQLKGPYQLWDHTHTFEEEANGTRIRDEVYFRLPFGWIGKMFGSSFVLKNVRSIFEYRHAQIDQYFKTSDE